MLRATRWLLASLMAVGALGMKPARAEEKPWVITFLDVGQGDSSLLQLPDGNNVLIDGGVSEMGDRVVKALEKRGVKSLDMVIMTHPHADHVGGLHQVFRHFPIRLVLDSGMHAASHAYGTVLDDINTLGIALKLGRPGLSKSYGPVHVEVLAPSEPLLTHTRSDINNASIVTRWVYDDVALLETGDAEQEALDRLLKSHADLQAQILKVPHHGSRYTSSAKFLEAVHPDVAVISCGLHNDYHHPHKQALQRLKKVGAKIYITAKQGDIAVQTDGHRYNVTTEKVEENGATDDAKPEQVEVQS